MNLSVSSYSFQQYLSAGKMTQLDCIKKAKDLGFSAIEFAKIIPAGGCTPVQYAKKLREEARAQKVKISCLSVGADFLKGGAENFNSEIENVKSKVDLAAALRVSRMRHDVASADPLGRTFDIVLPILAQACLEITEYAAQHGITTMVENHGFFCQHSSRMTSLFHAVNHPNFRLLCDIGNFLCVDESPKAACAAVAPYTEYVHVKDFYIQEKTAPPDKTEGYFRSTGGKYLKGSILGQGEVPIKDCINILRSAGYSGCFALEYEGKTDCIQGIEQGYAFLKQNL